MVTGSTLIEVMETASTNADAMALVGQVPDGAIVWAHNQTAGKGQRGAKWHAEPGANLTLSVLYYPRKTAAANGFCLSQLAAVAVARTVRAFLPPGCPVQVKWPNDVLVGRKKIAGILIETQVSGDYISAAVVGIGLNVNQSAFAGAYRRKPTSLALEAKTTVDLGLVRERLFEELDGLYAALRSGASKTLASAYWELLLGAHEPEMLTWDEGTHNCNIVQVNFNGTLIVETPFGLREFGVKEVSFAE